MAKPDETRALSWPWWAPWALLGVALTSLLTVAATLYDILLLGAGWRTPSLRRLRRSWSPAWLDASANLQSG